MQKRRHLLLLLPLCAALAVIAAFVLQSYHPKPPPKKVEALLWGFVYSSGEVRRKNEEAFRKLGAAALPELMAMLTPPGKIKLKLTACLQPLMKTPFARFVPTQIRQRPNPLTPSIAVTGFILLGQQAASQIPALERLARNPDATASAVQALIAIGTNNLPIVLRLATNSPTANPAVHGLVLMAEIGYPTHAIVADLARRNILPQTLQRAASLPPAQAIRILTNALQNPDANVRQTAAQCILRQKDTPEASLAIPALQHCTGDLDTEVQTAATTALRAIAPELFVTNSIAE